MAKVVKKKRRRQAAIGGSGGAEVSPERPKWVKKTPPCIDACPNSN